MCASRSGTLGCVILDLGLRGYASADSFPQRSRRVEIDLSAKDLRQLGLEPEEGEAWRPAGLELDEHIHIASLRREIVAHRGSEKREAADVVPLAELHDAFTVDGNPRRVAPTHF